MKLLSSQAPGTPGSVFALMLLLLWAGGAPGGRAEQPRSELLAAGKSIYDAHCLRCHGENGASRGYPEILPVAGITSRHSQTEIAELSAPFVGKAFVGEDGRALAAYLGTLRGQKGFQNPGSLFSPYLLRKKAGSLRQFRVVDLRSGEAYQQGHISNAVSWSRQGALNEECLSSPADTAKRLADSGISASTFVILYDDQGGPDATCTWWTLVRQGYTRLALLDGGWQGWLAAGHPAVAVEPRIEPAEQPPMLRPSESAMPTREGPLQTLKLGLPGASAQEVQIDWRQTLGSDGFRAADEIRAYLQQAGLATPGDYRVAGSSKELSHLVFVLHLLGDTSVAYDPEAGVLSLRGK